MKCTYCVSILKNHETANLRFHRRQFVSHYPRLMFSILRKLALTQLARRSENAAYLAADADCSEEIPRLHSAPVYVLCDEGLVRLTDGHLTVAAKGLPDELVRLDEISQLSLFGQAGITSACLRELMRRGIPVVWRSNTGYYAGQTIDLSGNHANTRRAQYSAAGNPGKALTISRTLVQAKIVNSRIVIRRNDATARDLRKTLKNLARRAGACTDINQLRGVEGAAAAAYFGGISERIIPSHRKAFAWSGRVRRPPIDRINPLLSYLYAVLVGECATAALAAGLDPAVGFLHSERPGRPALALDLVEPFRHVVADAVAISAINRGEVKLENFQRSGSGIVINDAGRRAILGAFERRLSATVPSQKLGAVKLTWRATITNHAHQLASALRSGRSFTSFEQE